MAFAIQTANGRYLNVIRWASHGTGGIGASGDGDYSQSKFPKEGRGRGDERADRRGHRVRDADVPGRPDRPARAPEPVHA